MICISIKLEKKGKRKCTICNKIYPLKNFYKNKKSLRGRQVYCALCMSKQAKERYKKNINSDPMEKNTKYNIYINPVSVNQKKSIWRKYHSDRVTDWHVKKGIVSSLRKNGIVLMQNEVPLILVNITKKKILLRREIQGRIAK